MTRFLLSRSVSIGLCSALLLGAAVAQDPAPAPTGSGSSGGFLTGLRGFEDFHEPLGQPIYFETPFNDTGVRALYLRHQFDRNSLLGNGNVTVWALQARLALSERWQFIATKDGYSEIQTDLLGRDYGSNDLAAGLKYVLVADREKDYVVSLGVRYMLPTGEPLYRNKVIRGINGTTDEWSPFVSIAKGYGDLHVLGNMTLRVPSDSAKGNTVGHWDLHVDYSANPEDRAVFAPLVELHGVHYLDDADGTSANAGLPIGGLDYTNLGSSPGDHFVCWAGLGARLEIDKRFELGACYEFALTDPSNDIMGTRVTVDFIVRF